MRKRTRVSVALVAGAAIVSVFALTSIGEATHTPANKVWASASTIEFMQKDVAPDGVPVSNGPGGQVVLAVAKAKFSSPTDLRLSVTSECALWTNTATTGDDDSESKARVEVWVTIDNNVVPVSHLPGQDSSTNTTGDDPDQQAARGRVVFCNRAARMKTEQIESGGVLADEAADREDDIRIRSYNRTRSANGFNWGAMDVGANYDVPNYPVGTNNGVVEIKVHARLVANISDSDTTDNNSVDSPAALAAIGKRTLYVEPVKMANDAAF